jgi:hypothetical protein
MCRRRGPRGPLRPHRPDFPRWPPPGRVCPDIGQVGAAHCARTRLGARVDPAVDDRPGRSMARTGITDQQGDRSSPTRCGQHDHVPPWESPGASPRRRRCDAIRPSAPATRTSLKSLTRIVRLPAYQHCPQHWKERSHWSRGRCVVHRGIAVELGAAGRRCTSPDAARGSGARRWTGPRRSRRPPNWSPRPGRGHRGPGGSSGAGAGPGARAANCPVTPGSPELARHPQSCG